MLEKERSVVEAAADKVALVDEQARQDGVTMENDLLNRWLSLGCYDLRRKLDEANFAVIRYERGHSLGLVTYLRMRAIGRLGRTEQC